ncbi:hypothetical protein ABZ883_08570 [Streptomyces sp. NPDC046977]|uniref:hypothetical protein n=1 Tax=Streptomyces sp. NPDC046977 TaxID=3154703 RepID=UPI0033E84EBC
MTASSAAAASGGAHAHAAPGPRHSVGHIVLHLVTPLLMCLGMGLAYLGAFHAPEPHGMKVAVVGTGPRAQVLAQTLKDKAGDALDVTTVPTRGAAVHQLMDRDLAGAYLPSADHPRLLVAKANSDTTATAAETVFRLVADRKGTALDVTDVAPTSHGDPTGQGLFFVLVTISIGSYASVAAIGAAGAALRLWTRAAIGLATSLVVSFIGTVLAGPVFDIVDHDLAAVWAMAWLYSAGIIAIGVGLHTFLKRWTTLTMMALFVMLNFTTSGGIFRPELQNGFFGALHAFWNGAGFVEGVRSILYFPSGAGLAGRVTSLVLWLGAGLVALAAADAAERRTRRAGAPPAPLPPVEREAEEEIGEAVAV